MKKRSGFGNLAAVSVAVACIAVLVPGALAAYPSTCDNCYTGENRWGEPDAQCCLDNRCEIWKDLDYDEAMSNMEWCTSWANEWGAGCHGQGNTCQASGGDGGGDTDCTISPGEYCPPSCAACYYTY